jgi:hypothetical protein
MYWAQAKSGILIGISRDSQGIMLIRKPRLRWDDSTGVTKSKSRYDRRSVGQSVLVSSPIWGSWPNIYCWLTFTLLSMSGAPSDERSGLSFVLVIVRPLLVNIYRFKCNAYVSDIYIYTICTRPMSVQAENNRSCSFLSSLGQRSPTIRTSRTTKLTILNPADHKHEFFWKGTNIYKIMIIKFPFY